MSSPESRRGKGRGEVAEPAEALEIPLGGEHEGPPVREERESERAGEYAGKPIEEKREVVEKVEAPPKPEGLWKGEPDATGILRNILEKHPDVNEAVKEEILDWARLQEFLSPQTLAYLLGQMRSVSSQTANIVAQKYSLALQKAQLESRPGAQMPILPQLQAQQPHFQVPVQGYPSMQPPFLQPPLWQQYPSQTQPQPTPLLTEEKIVAMVERVIKGAQEEREKESLASMFAKSVERQDRLLAKIEGGELFPKTQAATLQSQTPPVTKEEIAAMAARAASEAVARVVEATAKEGAEQRRHDELLSAIRSGTATQPVSGYKEDSYRFLGQELGAMAAAVERKEPIKIILQGVPQVISAISPTPPLPKELAPGAGGGDLAERVRRFNPEIVVEE